MPTQCPQIEVGQCFVYGWVGQAGKSDFRGPVKISKKENGNPVIPVQMERTIKVRQVLLLSLGNDFTADIHLSACPLRISSCRL